MPEICRLCGCKGSDLSNIFNKELGGKMNNSKYADEVMTFARVSIYKGDGLTEAICKRCIAQLTICRNFRILCEATDKKLRQFVRNESALIIKEETLEIEFESSDNCDGSQPLEIKIEDREISVGTKDSNVNEKNQDENNSIGDKQYHIIMHMCEHCGKQFKQRGSLLQHLRSHSGTKLFNCELCHKDFSRSAHLMIHMRIHDKIKPIICEVCGRPFRKSSDLIRHKRIHSDDRNFPCSVCGRAFKRSGDVTSHMRSHTGDRPFKCKHCSKSYTSHSSLKKHLQSTHEDACVPLKPDLKADSTLPVTNVTTE